MILVVDDDASVTASLALLLRQNGHVVRTGGVAGRGARRARGGGAAGGAPGHELLPRHERGRGARAAARDRARRPGVPVILMTAWGSIALAVEGMKAGAADFVTKPWTNAQLLQAVRTALGLAEAGAGAAPGDLPTREALDERCDFGALVGEDPLLLRALEVVARVAATDASVLVTGESGTGKELVAEAIHRNSRRRGGPFVKVNLGGIAASLFESEMFGHVRGAFTDARADRKGRFELAHGGTIFLDEIGETEPSSQVKLLRVLQDRTYEALGSSAPRTVDVRVVSATNRDLGALVAAGQFREDLLYRLNLITVHLPALRERPADVPRLAASFARQFAQAYGREVDLSPSALRWLAAQPWPGNVRQLRQWIERAVLVGRAATIEPADLEATGAMESRAAPRDALPPVGSMTLEEIERAMIAKSLKHHAATSRGSPSRSA